MGSSEDCSNATVYNARETVKASSVLFVCVLVIFIIFWLMYAYTHSIRNEYAEKKERSIKNITTEGNYKTYSYVCLFFSIVSTICVGWSGYKLSSFYGVYKIEKNKCKN